MSLPRKIWCDIEMKPRSILLNSVNITPYLYQRFVDEKEQPRLWHILTHFQSPFLENMGVDMYNKGYQMIELFILMQLIQ